MLATASVHELLENTKANQILSGRFLSTNNNLAFVDNESVYSVTVIDESQNSKPIAFGAFHICSKNQAYFILSECDPQYVNKKVAVEKIIERDEGGKEIKTSHSCMKIVKLAEPMPDFRYMHMYYGAFADRFEQPALVHVYDELVRMTLSTYNMDVSKNITLDLCDPEDLTADRQDVLRDYTGLVVCNDFSNYEITINRSTLQSLLNETEQGGPTVNYEDITERNHMSVTDYDATTSLYNREDYIEFLLKIKELKGVIALEMSEPVGYALALNNRIMQCYAENEDIARSLMKKLLEKMEVPAVSMFVREKGSWISEALHSKATEVKKIQRFHSRVVPAQIKWSNVFAMNIGLHLY